MVTLALLLQLSVAQASPPGFISKRESEQARVRLLTDYLEPGPGLYPLHVESVGRPLKLGVLLNETTQLVVTGYRQHSVHKGVTRVHARPLCETPCTLHVPQGLFPLTVDGDKPSTEKILVGVPVGGASVRLHDPSWAQIVVGGVLLTLSAVSAAAAVGFSLWSLTTQDWSLPIVFGAATLVTGVSGGVLWGMNPSGVAWTGPPPATEG